MTAGLLLDTHTAVWWRSRALLEAKARSRISEASASGLLYLSPISAWELVFALQKIDPARRPDLGGLQPQAWFDRTIQETGTRIPEFTAAIAAEAAGLITPYGSGDLGDCFLLATAHALNLTLVTRDARILAFAKASPAYVSAIRC